MNIEFFYVAIIGIVYVLSLFGIAYITERGWISEKITSHPITYILSLGIFASAWAFYGVVDLAFQYGYGALAYYIGTGALFLFAPVALAPLTELARRHQVHSLADLLVFRFHSNLVGALTTLCMLGGILPLMAMQIQAIADTMHILTVANNPELPLESNGLAFKDWMALGYCALLAFFTVSFGANREQYRGLITAMAFETLLKIIAFVTLGLVAVWGVFGGLDGLDNWLRDHPENLALLHNPINAASSHTLLLVFLATAVTMPHIFHIGLAENPLMKNSHTLTWAFPLFLLIMALPVFPILWAGAELSVPLPVQYYPLGVPIIMDSPALTLLAFLGGLSASTGAMVIITLALSTMLMNHWVLPTFQIRARTDLYRQLIWLRRVLIAAVFMGGYLFYWILDNGYSLTNLALTAFIATLQFLPGTFAVVYWSRGNRRGLVAGLAAGFSIWALGLLVPMLTDIDSISIAAFNFSIPIGSDYWEPVTLLSLSINTLLFIIVSLATQQTEDEAYSADLCAADQLSHAVRLTLDVECIADFKARLAKPLGRVTANREVEVAVAELKMSEDERRPFALRRLRDQIEGNLSSLMGIHVASEIMDKHIPQQMVEARDSVDINLIETRINQYRDRLTGMAAELNNLRLYHRRTLEGLPLAACSLGRDTEILMWNRAMANLTAIPSETVTGSYLANIPEPWAALLYEFSTSTEPHFYRREIQIDGNARWISLHKANIIGSPQGGAEDQVMILEDVTETQLLEQELVHSERLASVGRLAAGVAHEIGNPITGIACLAQNLRYESDEPENVLDTAEQILSQTDRVSRIVHSLVSYSHAGHASQNDFSPVRLSDCAEEAISLLSLQKDKHEVNFVNNIQPSAVVEGDAQRMIQVFINLLSNARDASPAQGRVMLDSTEDEFSVTISVTDEGTGIAPQLVERILEPFFTTKDPGEGTGLGLAMVYSIIQDHNGHLDIISPAFPDTNRGAKFEFALPRYTDSVI